MKKRYNKINVVERIAHQQYSYTEILAASLIQYAQNDAEFADHLHSLIEGLTNESEISTESPSTELISIVLPSSRESAVRRADWLADALERQALPHAHKAHALLNAWGIHRAQDDPEAVILGIKIGVMPIGIMGEQKLQEQMPIIARKDIVADSGTQFTNLVTHASLSTLTRALDQVKGDARSLEPEMGDWFYGEKTLKYYEATEAQISSIVAELEKVHVIHALATDEHGPAVLAMSPAVNSVYPEAHWDLKPIE
jgi:hypothetical protein